MGVEKFANAMETDARRNFYASYKEDKPSLLAPVMIAILLPVLSWNVITSHFD